MVGTGYLWLANFIVLVCALVGHFTVGGPIPTFVAGVSLTMTAYLMVRDARR